MHHGALVSVIAVSEPPALLKNTGAVIWMLGLRILVRMSVISPDCSFLTALAWSSTNKIACWLQHGGLYVGIHKPIFNGNKVQKSRIYVISYDDV